MGRKTLTQNQQKSKMEILNQNILLCATFTLCHIYNYQQL